MPKQVTDEMMRKPWHAFTVGKHAGKDDFDALRDAIIAIQSPPVGDELVELIERLQQEPVLVADQEPFVEIWESDFRQIMAALLSINGNKDLGA